VTTDPPCPRSCRGYVGARRVSLGPEGKPNHRGQRWPFAPGPRPPRRQPGHLREHGAPEPRPDDRHLSVRGRSSSPAALRRRGRRPPRSTSPRHSRGRKGVILIGADLRRPAIGAVMNVKPKYGVARLLIENVPLRDAVVTVPSFTPDLGFLLARITRAVGSASYSGATPHPRAVLVV
jgi:hypothetical protein